MECIIPLIPIKNWYFMVFRFIWVFNGSATGIWSSPLAFGLVKLDFVDKWPEGIGECLVTAPCRLSARSWILGDFPGTAREINIHKDHKGTTLGYHPGTRVLRHSHICWKSRIFNRSFLRPSCISWGQWGPAPHFLRWWSSGLAGD